MAHVVALRRIEWSSLYRQRGASLLEGLAYLGVAAVVILGAVSLLTNAFGNAQSNRMVEELTSLRTSARKIYFGQQYPAAMVPTLNNADAIPRTLNVDAQNNITNAWGGAVTVVGGNNGTEFTITYASVPRAVCISVVSGASGWLRIGVGNNQNAIVAFPVTADAANNNCNAAAQSISFVSS